MHIYNMRTYFVGKIVWALETGRKSSPWTGELFLPLLQWVLINFIFTNIVHVLNLSCIVKKSETTANIYRKEQEQA